MIRRHSSRLQRLDRSFLDAYLHQAVSYRRIAGYFTSSLFEVASEVLTRIPKVEIVCNVDVQPEDVRVAQLCAARMLGAWNRDTDLEADAIFNRPRYERLTAFFQTHGAGVIRAVPSSHCGFVHGKAGIITLDDGRKIGFIGSMNESRNGWSQHYEILWEDDSPEGVAWLEAEFDYLWALGVPLPELIVTEVKRRALREEVHLPDLTAERCGKQSPRSGPDRRRTGPRRPGRVSPVPGRVFVTAVAAELCEPVPGALPSARPRTPFAGR